MCFERSSETTNFGEISWYENEKTTRRLRGKSEFGESRTLLLLAPYAAKQQPRSTNLIATKSDGEAMEKQCKSVQS